MIVFRDIFFPTVPFLSGGTSFPCPTISYQITHEALSSEVLFAPPWTYGPRHESGSLFPLIPIFNSEGVSGIVDFLPEKLSRGGWNGIYPVSGHLHDSSPFVTPMKTVMLHYKHP